MLPKQQFDERRQPWGHNQAFNASRPSLWWPIIACQCGLRGPIRLKARESASMAPLGHRRNAIPGMQVLARALLETAASAAYIQFWRAPRTAEDCCSTINRESQGRSGDGRTQIRRSRRWIAVPVFIVRRTSARAGGNCQRQLLRGRQRGSQPRARVGTASVANSSRGESTWPGGRAGMSKYK
jgi:hypothetical protein